MANMYNQPKQSQFMQSYISQHVPLPIEEMKQTLLLKQGMYDKVEEYYQNAQTEFAGIQGVDGRDADYLAEKNSTLAEFISSIEGKDLTDPTTLKAIRQTVKSVASDPNLKKIQENYSKVKEFQENYKQAIKEDGYVRPENIYSFQKDLQRYKETGFEGGDLADPTINKSVDEFKRFKEYFDMLEPEERESINSLSYGDGQGGGNAYYTTKTKSRSSTRISQQTMNVLEDARSTAEGQQAMRRYRMEMEAKKEAPTELGALKYLAEQIHKAGQGYIFESVSSDKATALNRKDEKQSSFMPGITQTFSPKVIQGAHGLQYDANGEIVGKDGATIAGVANVVWSKGLAGIKDGTTALLIAGYLKGNSKMEKAQAAEHAKNIVVSGAVNGMSHEDVVKQSMKTQSFETMDYSKVADRDNVSKLLFDKGVGTWINTTMIDKKGNRIPAKQAVTKALGLSHDASIATITEALNNVGGISVLGVVKPGNPLTAKGAHVSLGGESFLIDYSGIYRPQTDREIAQWEKDKADHELAKLKTELVREDYDVDKQGNKVKVYDIWNFSKDTYDTYTEPQFQKLFEKQMQKDKK
jgi:hypothetical protein